MVLINANGTLQQSPLPFIWKKIQMSSYHALEVLYVWKGPPFFFQNMNHCFFNFITFKTLQRPIFDQVDKKMLWTTSFLGHHIHDFSEIKKNLLPIIYAYLSSQYHIYNMSYFRKLKHCNSSISKLLHWLNPSRQNNFEHSLTVYLSVLQLH